MNLSEQELSDTGCMEKKLIILIYYSLLG